MTKPSPKQAARIEALEAENAELRKALALADAPTTVESWGRHAPQHLRDRMAATALIAEKLDEPRALIRLGFHCPKNETFRWVPEVWVMAKAVFDTPGVREILACDMADAEANKKAIIARLVQTSLHGSDAEQVRSTQQLAKMAGWNVEKDSGAGANVTINLLQMLGKESTTRVAGTASDDYDPEAIIDGDYFLTHEPGGATVVADDEPLASLNR